MLEDDGHYLPVIKRHSLDKLRRHNYYAAIFASAMKADWPNLVYIGLYAGAGRARLKDTGEIVETSALAVLRQTQPFTHYIFVDESADCCAALAARIEALGTDAKTKIIQGGVNESIEQVLGSIPDYRRDGGVLSLCFVDPFRIDLDFDVIRRLGRLRVDFLIMIPLGYDVRRNRDKYIDDPEHRERLGRFLDDPNWIAEWKAERRSPKHLIRFALGKFDERMRALGYLPREMRDTATVSVHGKGVFLYVLALYSKHERGTAFWKTTIKGTSAQLDFGI